MALSPSFNGSAIPAACFALDAWHATMTSSSVWTDSVGAQGNGTASMVWVPTLPRRLVFHCISIPPPACRVLLDLEREQLPATKLETDDDGLVVRRIAQGTFISIA